MQYNINIWTVLWIETDFEQNSIPKVEIHKSYDSAMKRICELVSFTSDKPDDASANDYLKLSGLCMSEFII